VTIKQALWELYYAIYAMTLATDVDGVEMEDSEVEEIEDELQRDLIFSMKEIRGYSEKAWFVLFEVVKKHQLDDPTRSKPSPWISNFQARWRPECGLGNVQSCPPSPPRNRACLRASTSGSSQPGIDGLAGQPWRCGDTPE
jgi:hypothetical protein